MTQYTFDQRTLVDPKGIENFGWTPSRMSTQQVVAEGQKIAAKQAQVARYTQSSITEKLRQCQLQ